MDDIRVERMARFNLFFKSLNIKQIDFAQKLNTDPGFVSQLLNGHRKLTIAFAHKIGKVYKNLNIEWLIDGIGEMNNVLSIVSEPEIAYHKSGDAFDLLRAELSGYANRISILESEVAELRQMLESDK